MDNFWDTLPLIVVFTFFAIVIGFVVIYDKNVNEHNFISECNNSGKIVVEIDGTKNCVDKDWQVVHVE